MLYKSDISEEKIPAMMSDLTDWYDGYLFATDTTTRLFNPDMVLYFLQQYSIQGKYPQTMLDTNVASDYSKIKNIFKMGGEETARFALLEGLIQNGYIDFSLTELYNLDLDFTEDNFLSLLFYMGMLRLQEEKSSDWRFVIPNYVIKKLYFEYFTAIFLAKTRFAKSHHPITQTIDALVNDANPELFFKLVEYVLQENHSNRDEMVYGEKHLQTLMIGLLVPYKAFKIHSEPESKRQYPDIFLSRVTDRKMNYEVVLELKYVKKTAKDKLTKTVNKTGKEKLAAVVEEAETQLDGYMKTERFSRPDVRGFYVVFFGGEVYKWGEWGKY